MKILLLSPSLNSGGVETGTIDLSKSLKNLGEDVIVASSGGQLVRELEKANIKHIQLPIHKKSLTAFSQIPKLINIIKQEHIDIVHAQSRVPAWIAFFACKNTRIPFITSCHGYYSKHLFSNIMGWGKKVIVISQIIGRHMQENFGVPKERIRLVYRGVDLSRYHFQADKYRFPKHKFRIVNIARITPIKGQREFIKAINIVAKQIPNIEVWLVGSADKKKRHYEINLYRLVKELNLENKVKFLGRRSDISEILKDTDLLVLSTQVPEAFGRAIIEAGAIGVPVCATKIGGIVEIIEDKKDGLLFDCGDINSMAQAIIMMIKDPDLRQQCRKNLRMKIQDKFSLKQMSEETLDVYRETKGQKKILVIKLGGLGDLILATPSLKMLRRQFPKAKISLLINSDIQPLVRDCPYIDDIILFDRKKKRLLELIDDLRQREFNLSIDFKNNNLTHLIAYLAKITSRYGFSRGPTSFLLNQPETLPQDSIEQPVKQQLRILKKLGVTFFDDALELWPSREDDDFIDNALKEKGVLREDKLIGLAIGASPEWPTKDWPIDNFTKLSQMLIQEGLKVILLGTQYSKQKVDRFPDDNRVISFVGDTNLNQLVSLVKRLDVLITPDSAPMHIASAVGTKIIALFGPTEPKRHIPPGGEIDALVRQINCQPCYKRKCINKEKLACLEKISPEEVFNLITQKIN
ncbi:MAG: glycosyltransferase [Candidatus Omnitrophica bacterium]|nr:glycosyltransferase [Candidatus Omnitrophota bacterium]